MQRTLLAIPAVLALTLTACDKEEAPAAPAASATAKAPATAAPAPSATAAASAAAPAASASAAVPAHDCPAGTSGLATFDKPCEAKGTARAMEVTWTGKMDDKGPSFRVVNTTKDPILYGKIAVYFYDKAGKQLEAPSGGKPKPYHTCFGKLFGGVMKPAEKAVITFSCVKKADVPEGAAAIEAEMQTVGFSDASEQKIDWYWRNAELSPDTRKKAGK
jgi:hypothetical protein